jgi:hypothetical protein
MSAGNIGQIVNSQQPNTLSLIEDIESFVISTAIFW